MPATLVCDTNRLFAESLASCLGSRDVTTGTSGTTIVVVTDPADALAALSSGQIDTVVLSLRPGCRSLEVARAVRRERLVCLVSGSDEPQACAALDAGADAVVARTRPLDEVVAAVAGVALPPSLAARRHRGERKAPQAAYLRFLTARQREALELLVTARSTEDIAREMGITTATARGYVQTVLEKLGVHSRLEAVALADQQRRDVGGEAWCG